MKKKKGLLGLSLGLKSLLLKCPAPSTNLLGFFLKFIFGYVRVALAACYDVGSCGGGETSEDPRVELGVGENFVKTQTEK